MLETDVAAPAPRKQHVALRDLVLAVIAVGGCVALSLLTGTWWFAVGALLVVVAIVNAQVWARTGSDRSRHTRS